jgi:hypothetical protein
MQVTVDETLTAILNCQMLTYEAGEVVGGDVAVYLLRTGAAVTPADDDAEQLAESLTVEKPETAVARALRDAGVTVVEDVPTDDEDEVGEVEESEEIDVTTSTIDQVLAWVGGDLERARAAATAEESRGDRARTRLLGRLAEYEPKD